MEHLEYLLKGMSLVLNDQVLDQIDAIVPPGTNVYEPNIWRPPALEDDTLRRRLPGDRAASS